MSFDQRRCYYLIAYRATCASVFDGQYFLPRRSIYRELERMAPLPVLPLLAISMSLLSQMFVQVGLFSYGGYMVKHLDVVDNKDKAGEACFVQSSFFLVLTFAWQAVLCVFYSA